MFGSTCGYPPYTGSYPSEFMNPNFLGNNQGRKGQTKDPDFVQKEKFVAASQVWLLAPAIVGAAAAFLSLKRDTGPESCKKERPWWSVPGIIIFSGLVLTGVSFYIYNVLTALDGHSLYAFFPVSGAIIVQIVYFAAIYNWLYRIDPKSFTGEIDGNPINELVTFIYFSITTFATAGMGDMAPVTNAAKILVSLQVLFFIFIFTMGIVFFTDP